MNANQLSMGLGLTAFMLFLAFICFSAFITAVRPHMRQRWWNVVNAGICVVGFVLAIIAIWFGAAAS